MFVYTLMIEFCDLGVDLHVLGYRMIYQRTIFYVDSLMMVSRYIE